MKTLTKIALQATVCLLLHSATGAAQESRWFRVAGPVPTRITDITAAGIVTFTNIPTNAVFTVQTAFGSLVAAVWVDWAQVRASSAVTSGLFFYPTPPAGMVLIPAGEFTIGDTLDGLASATPTTNVTVSAFFMDRTEITWATWQDVRAWAINAGYSINSGAGKATTHPVQSVTWYDVVKWCNARSELAGLPPVYYTNAALTQLYKAGTPSTIYPDWNAAGYRLPTEAEWEKAARGGSSGLRFPWGNLIDVNRANYKALMAYSYDLGPTDGYHPLGDYPNTSPGTTPVGTFPDNAYGLYDMAGNVAEWCWDWYSAPYAGGTDPHGPLGPGSNRLFRGGAWDQGPYRSRCADRNIIPPNNSQFYIGFRCVRRL